MSRLEDFMNRLHQQASGGDEARIKQDKVIMRIFGSWMRKPTPEYQNYSKMTRVVEVNPQSWITFIRDKVDHFPSEFPLIERLSITYGNKKGLPQNEAVPLCGQRDKYLTILDDSRSVYLLGAQMVDIDSPIIALTSGQLTSSNITGMGSASASSK